MHTRISKRNTNYKLIVVMRKEGKVSKVAVCPHCGDAVLFSHVDYLSKQTEKEFTEFSNEGYTIKLETIEESKKRNLNDCKCLEIEVEQQRLLNL